MRLARKLFLLAAMAITALALTAGTATAQESPVEVSAEASGTHCGTVTKTVHAVSGGCLVEFQSTESIPMHAYIPQKVTLLNCTWHFTARIGENGTGNVVAAAFADGAGPGTCTRAPCDEASGTFIPWPISIVEHAAGGGEFEFTFCLRTIASGPGGPGTNCELHLEFAEVANHDYEIGHHGNGTAEEFCETFPSPPVSFEDAHFRYETGSERIEVSHL